MKVREFRSASLAETVYAPHLRMPRHTHERAYLSVVLAGSYLERLGSWAWENEARSFVLHPAEGEHDVQFGAAGARIFTVELKPALLALAREHGLRFEPRSWCATGNEAWLAARLYREFQSADSASSLAVEGLALELMAELIRLRPAPVDPRARLARVRERLEESFVAPPALAELAQVAGVHPVYLSRAFREAYGLTIGEYVRQLKLELATRLLAGSTMPLGEVAVEAGFADQAHLGRFFRRATGLTPLQYRKTHRKG